MAIVKDLGRPESIIDRHTGESNTSARRIAITPSDTVNFPISPREITVGGAGDVACVNFDNTVTVVTAVAGQTIIGLYKRINSTATTATGLTGVM